MTYIFKHSFIILHTHQQSVCDPVSLHPCQHLVLYYFQNFIWIMMFNIFFCAYVPSVYSFGEMSVCPVFWHFSYCIVCFCFYFWEFFLYSRCKTFARYVICKHFLQVCYLSFYCLNMKVLNLMKTSFLCSVLELFA